MTKCLVTEDALVPAVLCAFFAILLVPPALRVLASLFGRGDRTTIAEPRKAGPEWERDDGSRLHPITSFGAWGRADGCLNSPRFLLPVEGGVLVADSGNDRLQIFTADGSHVRTIQGSRPGHPTGLATDGTHVWVADSSNCSVTKIVLKVSPSPITLALTTHHSPLTTHHSPQVGQMLVKLAKQRGVTLP